MPSNSQIISEFNQIAITDADGALEGLSVAKLEVADIANLTIPGGTQGQVIATDGSGNLSWASGGSGGGAVIAENGTVTCPLSSGTPISTSPATPTKVLTFNLPSAGTWEITACLSVGTLQPTSSYAALYSGSTTTPAVQVAGTIQAVGGISGGAGIQIGTDRVWTVTTTGAATYSVGMWGSGTVVIYTVDGGGITRGIWKKISGYIPSTGTLQTYAKYTRSTPQTGTLSTNARVICNVLESSSGSDITVDTVTGQITLAGGKTYRLRGQVPAMLSGSANSRNSFQWYNETTSAWVGSGSDMYQPADGASGLAAGGTAEYIFTASATTIVSFRVAKGDGLTSLGASPDFPASGSYPWIDIEVMGTSSVAQFVGTLSSVYSPSLSYPAGTIVVKDGMLYQSNGTVSAGTVFVLGSSGATWAQIGFGQVTAENGSVSPLNGQSFVSAGNPDSPWTDITNGSFTLGAGTWQVEYLLSFTNANGSWVQARLLDPNGNPVADSRTAISPGSGTPSFTTSTVTITNSVSTAYKLQARAFNGSTTTIQNYSAGTTGAVAMQGQSYVRWNKISGFVPAIGQAVAYGTYQITARTTAGDFTLTALQGNMPVVSSTTVSLKAGVTYELRASLAIRCTWSTFAWQTAAGIQIGASGDSFSANSNDPGVTVPAYAVYTPTADTLVKLYLYTVAGYTETNPAYGEVSIKQIGTTSTAQFTGTMSTGWSINNTYAQGTIVVKDGMFYQANDTVFAGTTFSLGTSGATWSQVGFGQVTAENGSITNIANQSTASTTPVDVTGSTFTLPSAGTWSVTYEMSLYSNNGSGGTEIVLANSSTNAVVPGSKTSQNISTNEIPTSKTVQITTTGPTQYKLRFNTRGVGTSFLAMTNDVGAIYWTKISGFVPAVGTSSAYLSLSGSTTLPVTTTIAAGTDFVPAKLGGSGIAYNSGIITLTAGITYEFILTMTQAYGETASTVESGDVNIAICDATTLVVIPGGDCRAVGTQFTGRALSRSGTTAVTYTPTTNQAVKIRSTYVSGISGTAILCTVKQLGTTNSTAFTGSITNAWSINNTYPQGTIVVKDGALYQANSTIIAGTAWTVGAVSGTWAPIGTGQVAAEYGSQILNGTVTMTNAATVDVMSFTIPSAGTWEIEYTARGKLSSAATFISPMITDSNNVLQDGSMTIINYLTPATYTDFQGSSSSTAVVTTSGPAVYKLRAYCASTTTAFIVSDTVAGQTKVSWKKIGGFLPATGTVTSYTNALYVASQPASGATGLVKATTVTGNIPYDSATGVWTLTAGQTYQLWATWQTTTANEIDVIWVDATTNFSPPNILGGYTIGNNAGPQTSGIYTPQTNQQLKLWVSFGAGGQINTGRFQASIVQLGTTNVSGFLGTINNGWSIDNTYPAGTIVVNNGLLYQANTTILAGTVWAVGTTGATWLALGNQQAEYGEAVVSSNVNIPASNIAAQTADVLTFSLPSAGVWDVTYNIRCGVGTTGSFVTMFLADQATNTQVPTSNSLAIFVTGATGLTYQGGCNMTTRITTTGPTVYKLRGRASGDAVASVIFGYNDSNGGSKVSWQKISGFASQQTANLTAPLQITATTTAPVKAATIEVDYLSLVDDGSGWCQVSFEYAAAVATGSAPGTGYYLYSLPTGYRFDPAFHPYDTVTTSITAGRLNKIIPGSSGFVGVSTSTSSAVIIPYDATRFKVVTVFQTGGIGNQAWVMTDSGYYAMNGANYAILGSFRFKKQ